MEDRLGKNELEEPSLVHDMLEAVPKALLGAVPVVGPFISDLTGVALKAGTNRKQYKFLTALSSEIEILKQRLDASVNEIFSDPEFQSYLTRAVMIAWETHEYEKIRAVACAAVHSGPWEGTGVSEKEYYWSLLRRYSADYLVILRAFHHPNLLWEDWEWTMDEVPFDLFFQQILGFPAHHDEISQAIMSTFYQDQLTSAIYGLGNKFTRGDQSRLKTLGGDFVKFYEDHGAEPMTDG